MAGNRTYGSKPYRLRDSARAPSKGAGPPLFQPRYDSAAHELAHIIELLRRYRQHILSEGQGGMNSAEQNAKAPDRISVHEVKALSTLIRLWTGP